MSTFREIDDFVEVEACDVARFFIGLIMQETHRLDVSEGYCSVKSALLPSCIRTTVIVASEAEIQEGDAFSAETLTLTAASHGVGNVAALISNCPIFGPAGVESSMFFLDDSSPETLLRTDFSELSALDDVLVWVESALEKASAESSLWMPFDEHYEMHMLLDEMDFLRNW